MPAARFAVRRAALLEFYRFPDEALGGKQAEVAALVKAARRAHVLVAAVRAAALAAAAASAGLSSIASSGKR